MQLIDVFRTTWSNHANWFRGFKDVGSQSQWPQFRSQTLYV